MVPNARNFILFFKGGSECKDVFSLERFWIWQKQKPNMFIPQLYVGNCSVQHSNFSLFFLSVVVLFLLIVNCWYLFLYLLVVHNVFFVFLKIKESCLLNYLWDMITAIHCNHIVRLAFDIGWLDIVSNASYITPAYLFY